MKAFRQIIGLFTFVFGAIFGLMFAQRKGSDFRNDLYKGIKKGKTMDVFTEEASGIGKDIWSTAVGMKDSKEVSGFINQAETSLVELADDAKEYGGEVAQVLAKKYAEIAKKLTKKSKELEKSAGKEIKKATKRVQRSVKTAKKTVAKKLK